MREGETLHNTKADRAVISNGHAVKRKQRIPAL
jgi:hypothetical protein